MNNDQPLFADGYFEEKGMELFQHFPNWRLTHGSLTSNWQIAFLLGLISDYQFANMEKIKNVLEIGVFRGVTSLYMLKAGLFSCPDFELYGIDIGKDEVFGEAVFVEASIEEQKHYHLHRGCTSFDIEKVIPQNTKIDMAFIDGGHSHPHPVFDLIHLIPFLHNESIVMLHDVVDYMRPNAWGESFIFTGWTDRKYQTLHGGGGGNSMRTTLGCIKIPDEKFELYENIRKIAKIPFRASPWKFCDKFLGVDNSLLNRLKLFMAKYYDKDFVEEIHGIFRENLAEYERNWLLYHHETKFYNYLFENTIYLNRAVTDLQKQILAMNKKANDFYPFIYVRESILQSRKLYVWGTGEDGIRVKKQCENNGWQITGFLDSDKSIEKYDEYRVERPEQILSKPKRDFFIIISSRKYAAEIAEICEDAGLKIGQDFWRPIKYE